MTRNTNAETHTQPCRHQGVINAARKPETPSEIIKILTMCSSGTILKKVRARSGSFSLRNASMAAAWTPCASIKVKAKNMCRKTSQLYTCCSLTTRSVSGMVAQSIARGLFPCHQMDSRSFGKFVPAEAGMYPPSLSLLVLLRRVQRVRKQLFKAFAVSLEGHADRYTISFPFVSRQRILAPKRVRYLQLGFL